MTQGKFLTAEWRELAMANYAVDSKILLPFVPFGTELDYWNGTCYISLVGFMFLNTKLKSISIPFHSNFEEVNLRFYVRYRDNSDWKRGVVFIKEIVPRPALTFVANWMYGERYETMSMKHVWEKQHDKQIVEYRWLKNSWHKIRVESALNSVDINPGSEEEFITEHFWGYTKINDRATSEYQVEHPRWKVYPVINYQVDVDFGLIYGNKFSFLAHEKPASVFLAEGSEITVRSGTKISPGLPVS